MNADIFNFLKARARERGRGGGREKGGIESWEGERRGTQIYMYI